MNGGDNQDGKSSGGTPANDPSHVPRSGSGADTALEVMIRKRKMDTHGEVDVPTADESRPAPLSGK